MSDVMAMSTDRIVTKYMTFQRVENRSSLAPKTSIWDVLNNRSGDPLAEICWYVPWRQYCAFAEQGVVFNDSCLRTIADFLTKLNGERREAGR